MVLHEDDCSKFQRAKAKANKRQAKLSLQQDTEVLLGEAPAAAVAQSQQQQQQPLPPPQRRPPPQQQAVAATAGPGDDGAGATSVAPTPAATGAASATSDGTHFLAKNVEGGGGEGEGDAEEEEEGGGDDEDEDDADDDDGLLGDLTAGSAGMAARRSLCLEAARDAPEPFLHLVYVGGPYRKNETRVVGPGATIGSSTSNGIVLPTALGPTPPP